MLIWRFLHIRDDRSYSLPLGALRPCSGNNNLSSNNNNNIGLVHESSPSPLNSISMDSSITCKCIIFCSAGSHFSLLLFDLLFRFAKK